MGDVWETVSVTHIQVLLIPVGIKKRQDLVMPKLAFNVLCNEADLEQLFLLSQSPKC